MLQGLPGDVALMAFTLKRNLQSAHMQHLTADISCCREEFIAMGLFHIAKAVGFLNNDCKLVRYNALLELMF
jgi:hypothetical protein